MIYICSNFYLSMLDRIVQKTLNKAKRSPIAISLVQARDYVKDFKYVSNIRSPQAVKALSDLLGISLDLYTSIERKKLGFEDNLLIGVMVPFNFRIGYRAVHQQVDIEWWIV